MTGPLGSGIHGGGGGQDLTKEVDPGIVIVPHSGEL